MIVLGCPVLEKQEITEEMFANLLKYVANPDDIQFVLIDNGSEKPYKIPKKFPFKLDLIRNKKNLGFYYPLKQLYDKYPKAEFIGLMHNDVIIMENAWDKRIKQAFDDNLKLGLLGLFGAREIYANGTENDYVSNFSEVKSAKGKKGVEIKTTIIKNIMEVLTLDSLFMLFRRKVVPHLKIDKHISLCHFYDKIWSLRTINAGYEVAVIGILFSHKSDTTSKSIPYYKSAAEWFVREHGIAISNEMGIDYFIWLEARARYLMEFRELKGVIPWSL